MVGGGAAGELARWVEPGILVACDACDSEHEESEILGLDERLRVVMSVSVPLEP